MFVSKSEERRSHALRKRNAAAASLREGQFQPKKIAPKKGRGSFRRHNKHKARLA